MIDAVCMPENWRLWLRFGRRRKPSALIYVNTDLSRPFELVGLILKDDVVGHHWGCGCFGHKHNRHFAAEVVRLAFGSNLSAMKYICQELSKGKRVLMTADDDGPLLRFLFPPGGHRVE